MPLVSTTCMHCYVLFVCCLYRGRVVLSLNNRDSVEGDDQTVKDLGFVSGDLVYVISNRAEPDAATRHPESKSATSCSSKGCESVAGGHVVIMEVETVSGCSSAAVMSDGGSDDESLECRKTDAELSGSEAYRETGDNCSSSIQERVEVAGSTRAMLTEELQLVNRYLNEPMVVREATDNALPQTLVVAYSLVQPQTADAALLVVLDVLMSELGYQRTVVGFVRFMIYHCNL